MDSNENRVRILAQEIESLRAQVISLLESVEVLTKVAERQGEEREYVPGQYQGPEFA